MPSPGPGPGGRLRTWLADRRIEQQRDRDAAGLEAIDLELQDGSGRTALIALSGLQGALSMPVFEFFNATAGFDCRRIFVRDLLQAWYHRGLPGYSTDLSSTTTALRGLIEAHGIERVVLAGSSSGGYAALAFGALLEADVVLSFAPQTTLDVTQLHAIPDHRWDDWLLPLARRRRFDRAWIDTREVLAAHDRGQTDYRIFYADENEGDCCHADRLAGVPGVTLCPVRFSAADNHAIARGMRDDGSLTLVLKDALTPSAG